MYYIDVTRTTYKHSYIYNDMSGKKTLQWSNGLQNRDHLDLFQFHPRDRHYHLEKVVVEMPVQKDKL